MTLEEAPVPGEGRVSALDSLEGGRGCLGVSGFADGRVPVPVPVSPWAAYWGAS